MSAGGGLAGVFLAVDTPRSCTHEAAFAGKHDVHYPRDHGTVSPHAYGPSSGRGRSVVSMA